MLRFTHSSPSIIEKGWHLSHIHDMKINEILQNNSYPGRGIMLGKSSDGKHTAIVYFIMGRSENSRNRIFETTQDGIRTKAFDESKCTDPSLIIYSPVRVCNGITIVTNGDQTDTIYDELSNGGTFASALKKRSFEPDAPNFTPRISGIVTDNGYELSILKSEDGTGTNCLRCFYCYENDDQISGTGHFIHTYRHNGNPLPSFAGEPERVEFEENSAGELAEKVWFALDDENKVSLFVRFIDRETGKTDTVIINRHEEK